MVLGSAHGARPAEERVVGEDALVADLAIVGNVGTSHEEVA